MCLAVPGRVVEVINGDAVFRTGRVSFGGVVRDVCLAYTPEAGIDDYVLVHAGFAINRIDEAEAERIFAYLEEIGEIESDEPADEGNAR